MLKEQIIAYVTGTINAHTKSSVSKGMLNIKDDTAEEFEKFLDFIEDIPEEKASEDTEGLKKTTDGLEILELVRCERNILKTRVEELTRQLNEKNDLEQYAGFIKAIRAFREEGKDIQCKIYKCTKTKHIYRRTDISACLKDERNMPLSAYEIIYGKWSIEGDEKQE